MHVVGHDNVTIYQHAFILDAMQQAIDQYVSIASPAKNIYPIHNSKCKVVHAMLVIYLVARTHEDMFIEKYKVKLKRRSEDLLPVYDVVRRLRRALSPICSDWNAFVWMPTLALYAVLIMLSSRALFPALSVGSAIHPTVRRNN